MADIQCVQARSIAPTSPYQDNDFRCVFKSAGAGEGEAGATAWEGLQGCSALLVLAPVEAHQTIDYLFFDLGSCPRHEPDWRT